MKLFSDLKHLHLYNSGINLYIPFDPSDKRHGTVIKVLSRNYKDTLDCIQYPYIKNPNLYKSYYVYKSIIANLDNRGIVSNNSENNYNEQSLLEGMNHKDKKIYVDSEGTYSDYNAINELSKNINLYFKLFNMKNKTKLNIYGFNSVKNMEKAIESSYPGAINKLNKPNTHSYSYCFRNEIYLINKSYFHYIKKEELNYETYVNNELATWSFITILNCSRRIGNIFGLAVSGHCEVLRNNIIKKSRNDSHIIYNIDKDLSIAHLIHRLIEDKGEIGLLEFIKTKDPSMLVQYQIDDIKNLGSLVTRNIINNFFRESKIVLESDGTRDEVLSVVDDLSKRENLFLTGGFDYASLSEKAVVYRHVIHNDDTVKGVSGFLEAFSSKFDIVIGTNKSNYKLMESVTIGIAVHPSYRKQGLGNELVRDCIENIRKENNNIGRLIWYVNKNNIPSKKLAQSNGFKFVTYCNDDEIYVYYYPGCEPSYAKYLAHNLTHIDRLEDFLNKYKIVKDSDVIEERTIMDIVTSMRGNSSDFSLFVALCCSTACKASLILTTKFTKDDKIIFHSNAFCSDDEIIAQPYEMIDLGLLQSIQRNNDNVIKDYSKKELAKFYNQQFHAIADIGYNEEKSFYPNDFLKDAYDDDNVYDYAMTYIITDLYNYLMCDFTKVNKTNPEILINKESYSVKSHIPYNKILNESGILKSKNNDYLSTDNMICFFNENYQTFLEDNIQYEGLIRKYLYRERLKSNQDVLNIYTNVKEKYNFIQKTYLTPELYRSFNMILDLSYYNNVIMNNMKFVNDKAVLFYWNFLKLLLKDDKSISSLYHNKYLFIPVSRSVWNIPNDIDITDYKQTINPISVIIRMIRKNIDEVKSTLGTMNILFLSKESYFTVNFDIITIESINKIKKFARKMCNDTIEIDDDYENNNDNSKDAEVVEKIENIEKKSDIKIDNLYGDGTLFNIFHPLTIIDNNTFINNLSFNSTLKSGFAYIEDHNKKQ